MPFEIRCPRCNAKLRLPEVPEAGTPLDCPKCGTEFPVRADQLPKEKPAEVKQPKAGKKGKTVVTEDRTFMNEWALLGIFGGSYLALLLVLGTVWFLMSRVSKAEDVVAAVPEDFTQVRGVNLEQMRKMPGYKEMVGAVYSKPIQEGIDVIAKGLGFDAETGLGYFVIAYDSPAYLEGTGRNSELYVFRTLKPFDPGKIGSIEGVRSKKDSKDASHTYYGFDAHANKFLDQCVVECPTNTLVVVTRRDPDGKLAAAASELARSKGGERYAAKCGAIGKIAIKAHFWTISKSQPVGFGKVVMEQSTGDPKLRDATVTSVIGAVTKSKVTARWATFGTNGLRIGAGVECDSTSSARQLQTSFEKSPIGSGEDYEASTAIKNVFPVAGSKKVLGEVMQSLSFNTNRTAAFLRTRVESDEGRMMMFDYFIAPRSEWDLATISTAGQGPQGAPVVIVRP